MIKTAIFFVRELFHRLGQHPFAAFKKVLNPAIWKKLMPLAVGETVQPTSQPVLPTEMVEVLRTYPSAVDKAPFIQHFLEVYGRLVAPSVENPRVSIIVPAYN